MGGRPDNTRTDPVKTYITHAQSATPLVRQETHCSPTRPQWAHRHRTGHAGSRSRTFPEDQAAHAHGGNRASVDRVGPVPRRSAGAAFPPARGPPCAFFFLLYG